MKKLKDNSVLSNYVYRHLSSSPGGFGCGNHTPLVTFAVRMGMKEQVALQTKLQDTRGTLSVNVKPTDAAGLCVWGQRQQIRTEK